jgi:hypothetical protein
MSQNSAHGSTPGDDEDDPVVQRVSITHLSTAIFFFNLKKKCLSDISGNIKSRSHCIVEFKLAICLNHNPTMKYHGI